VILKNILLVALGGMLGSVLRYLASLLITHNSFPAATFTVNVCGCFAIGLIMGLAGHTEGFGEWRLFLATGVCGGFTTFSAFSWESINLMQQGRYGAFAVYAGGSFILGLGATLAGYLITR